MKTEQDTERSTRTIVNLAAVAHNIDAIRKRIGNERKLMAVVKADGYGYGALEVSLSARNTGFDSGEEESLLERRMVK